MSRLGLDFNIDVAAVATVNVPGVNVPAPSTDDLTPQANPTVPDVPEPTPAGVVPIAIPNEGNAGELIAIPTAPPVDDSTSPVTYATDYANVTVTRVQDTTVGRVIQQVLANVSPLPYLQLLIARGAEIGASEMEEAIAQAARRANYLGELIGRVPEISQASMTEGMSSLPEAETVRDALTASLVDPQYQGGLDEGTQGAGTGDAAGIGNGVTPDATVPDTGAPSTPSTGGTGTPQTPSQGGDNDATTTPTVPTVPETGDGGDGSNGSGSSEPSEPIIDDGGQPIATVNPDGTDASVTPTGVPENPNTPDAPDVPDTGVETPDAPNVPDVPVTPNGPDIPDASTPDTPSGAFGEIDQNLNGGVGVDTPDTTPPNLQGPAVPDVPNVPEGPTVPDTPGIPDATDAGGSAGLPDTSGITGTSPVIDGSQTTDQLGGAANPSVPVPPSSAGTGSTVGSVGNDTPIDSATDGAGGTVSTGNPNNASSGVGGAVNDVGGAIGGLQDQSNPTTDEPEPLEPQFDFGPSGRPNLPSGLGNTSGDLVPAIFHTGHPDDRLKDVTASCDESSLCGVLEDEPETTTNDNQDLPVDLNIDNPLL